jgi:uncharacterized protein YndB with AHSA1/START domain
MIIAQSAVVVDRPVEDVFAFVSDCTNEPRWHTDVIEAAPTSPGPLQVGSTERWVLRFMGRRENRMRVTELVPNRSLALQGEHDLMGTRAALRYDFEPTAAGTRFSRRIQIDLIGAARLMQPLMRAMATRRNARFVRNLKRVLER